MQLVSFSSLLLGLIVALVVFTPPVQAQTVGDHCLARWEWTDEDHWNPPHMVDALGWIDLRTLAQAGTAGGEGGWMFGVYDSPMGGTGMDCYGANLEKPMRDSQVTVVELVLGRPARSLESRDWRNILWEIYTVDASPDGSAGPKPILPNHNGVISLRLGGHGTIKDERLRAGSHPAWPKVQEVLRQVYRETRQKVLDGNFPADTHRKVLGNWLNKYSTDDHTLFIPNDLPNEEPIDPSTTITDDFNRTDSGDLGGNWTIHNAGFEIISNQAETTSSAEVQYTASSLSSDDHFCQVTAVNHNSDDRYSCRARMIDNDDAYFVEFRPEAGTDLRRIRKEISTTQTTLCTSNAEWSAGAVFNMETDGSAMEAFEDSVSICTATDTDLTGQLQCGLKSNASGSQFDDFECSDLAAPPPDTLAAKIWWW